MKLLDGRVPAYWWTIAPNFGDLIAPWLIRHLSGKDVVYSPLGEPGYFTIGSVLGEVRSQSVVWGTGSFGTERAKDIKANSTGAEFLAVRGPLTRNKIRLAGLECPAIYGDPALLVPDFHPRKEQPESFELGIVIRWSDKAWKKVKIPGVRFIDLETEDVDGTLDQFLSCKRILTSSLHGLIIADAYSIPSAWLASRSPKGLEFKFWDYFASVDKIRHAHSLKLQSGAWTLDRLINEISYDDREIKLDLQPLRACCPFSRG
ncbi:polysaccharide pyruvyl transferase family protein [Sphingomonas sp. ID0503]|uniref:polysaccharide pyruvyl transferase family protein n=1 Tax=Sphingomonas sp. ID0503 TaxID=3399691 RepID=UPI003AFA3918